MKKRLSIEGMTCGHCVARVKAALSGVQGVASATVDLASRTAIVEGGAFEDAQLKAAVADAGYEVVAVSPAA